ncbi:MAG: beta-ketoacyl synthase chain length factor [Desulfobacterales bacterium]|nr:MAG: beta-ketoacyl synthase chain length factor [Desulfobacterales bacterium]
MRIALRGVGVVGGFGCGVDDLRRTLIAGRCSPQTASVAGTEGAGEMPVFLADTSRLAAFIPNRALRRVDHFSRLAALGACLALEDARLPPTVRQALGLVIATGYGATRTTFSFLDTVLDHGDACASPTFFSNSVSNAAAAHVSILLKITGPSLTVSQFEMSVPAALLTACQWLEEKRVEGVLVGGVDEYCAVLGYSWQRFFGPGPTTGTRPLEWGRQSAIAGEGAAFFLLCRDEGDPPDYGFITDIRQGHLRHGGLDLAADALLLLGADGHQACARRYARHLPADARVATYTPLYGSLPVGPAFDMAVAALSIKAGRIFAPPPGAGENPGLKIVPRHARLDATPIRCLKFGREGEYAMVTLSGRGSI